MAAEALFYAFGCAVSCAVGVKTMSDGRHALATFFAVWALFMLFAFCIAGADQ